MLFDLNGKVAIVTGATKSLGYNMALALADAGADIVVVSRTEEDCDRVTREIECLGRKALACPCDVTKPDMIAGLVKNTLDRFGKIDILVNNAGVAVTKPALDLTEEDWDRVLNINLKAVFMMSQAVGRIMVEQKFGRIINIGSVLGLVAEKLVLPYLASKGGLVQLTKGLALEWAKYNVQVNCVAPGYVLTPINEKDLSEEKVKNHLLNKIPMRRFGKTSEIAGAVVFLSSDAASYITGSVLAVDGGWLAE